MNHILETQGKIIFERKDPFLAFCRYLKNYDQIMSDEKRTQNVPCREHTIFVGINLGRHPISFSVNVIQMWLSLPRNELVT